MTDQTKRKLPTQQELAQMEKEFFPKPADLCAVWCDEYQDAWDVILDGTAPPKIIASARAQVLALNAAMRAHNCPNCPIPS